jgi:uncharacterized protein
MKLLSMCFLVAFLAGPINTAVLADPPSDDTIREFHTAVGDGDMALAEKMIGSSPDLISSPYPDDDQNKRIDPVFTAIDHQQPRMLGMLLKHGASAKTSSSGQTPLDRATVFGDVEVMKTLLDAGANVDGLTDDSRLGDLDNPSHCTPLRDAVSCGHLAIAHLLVERGAHVDLFSASGLGWTGFVTQQIKLHPDQTDFTDDWRYTPLCYAVAGGCAGTAEVLLSHGADITHTFDDGGTLLHLATLNGYHDLMVVMLAHGADINVKNKAGETAMDFAIKYKQDDAAQLLKDHGGKRSADLHD